MRQYFLLGACFSAKVGLFRDDTHLPPARVVALLAKASVFVMPVRESGSSPTSCRFVSLPWVLSDCARDLGVHIANDVLRWLSFPLVVIASRKYGLASLFIVIAQSRLVWPVIVVLFDIHSGEWTIFTARIRLAAKKCI